MTQDEIIRMAYEAGAIKGEHTVLNHTWFELTANHLERFAALVAANESEKQAEQEPVPTGATHYQPHQKTYYKRVSATEWYLWSCTGKGWLPSKGTSDSSEWIMLSPIQAHQPAEQAEQEPVAWVWLDDWLNDGYADDCFSRVNHQNKTPLYAAPVRTKDLTDEEIETAKHCLPRYFAEITDDDLNEFARAVIQEYRRKNGIV